VPELAVPSVMTLRCGGWGRGVFASVTLPSNPLTQIARYVTNGDSPLTVFGRVGLRRTAYGERSGSGVIDDAWGSAGKAVGECTLAPAWHL